MKTSKLQPCLFSKTQILFAFLLLYSGIRAQDVLTLKNGEELNVKVIELSAYQVKFKPTSNLDGPLRVLYKSEIFSIKYSNGTKELFNNGETTEQNSNSSTTERTQQSNYYDAPMEHTRVRRLDFDPDTSDFAKKKRKNFSGPRVGLTFVTQGTTATYLESQNKNPFLAQFGWQFETRLFTTDDGTSGLLEFVPMVGGINLGMFLPSASFLIGLRGGSDKSWEFALGPNFGMKANSSGELTGSIGLVVALGTSFKKGNVWFPINLVVVPSIGSVETEHDPSGQTIQKRYETGWRIGLIAGFNSRRR